MNILITGACGFVGSSLCRAIAEHGLPWKITGFDHLGRRGSELNLPLLSHLGVSLIHGDLRCQSDVDALPQVDWVIDAAANPSVLAGADGRTSSRQLMEHNLGGTIHLLEKCRRELAGLVLLSTSRVYAIEPLAAIPVAVEGDAFVLDALGQLPDGVGMAGIRESFSTAAPVSLYGASKLASEALALEYGATFDFPVWINRCGVLAGAGQFGRPDQGIFAYWVNAHLRRKPIRYLGFGGSGHQVRDCLHPRDLLHLLQRQMSPPGLPSGIPRVLNVAGGANSAMSLRQLTAWCDERFGAHPVVSNGEPRPFDLPWVVLDATLAAETWQWQPQSSASQILDEIAGHAQQHPHWLETTGG